MSSTLYMIELKETKDYLNDRYSELYLVTYESGTIIGSLNGILSFSFEANGRAFYVSASFSADFFEVTFFEKDGKKTLRECSYFCSLTGTWAEDVRNTLLEQGNCYCK